jgi:hypothetical protein
VLPESFRGELRALGHRWRSSLGNARPLSSSLF